MNSSCLRPHQTHFNPTQSLRGHLLWENCYGVTLQLGGRSVAVEVNKPEPRSLATKMSVAFMP